MRPADVEAAFLAVLPAPAATRVPQTRPSAFTRVSRIGGGRVNVVQSRPNLLIECWASDDLSALIRAGDAWEAINAAQHSEKAGVWLGGIDLSEPVAYPDPDAPGQFRYQFTAAAVVALTLT